MQSHTYQAVACCRPCRWKAAGDGTTEGLFYREPEGQLALYSQVSQLHLFVMPGRLAGPCCMWASAGCGQREGVPRPPVVLCREGSLCTHS